MTTSHSKCCWEGKEFALRNAELCSIQNISFTIFLIMIFFTHPVFAQNFSDSTTISEKSISVSGGLGWLAVRDKAISEERYSGPLSYFSVDWKYFRENEVLDLDLNFRKGPK